uniref:Uncharacterized protein n=1 Tax=Parasteatoda tepidariorum TaxID=114398 RepID=A0A2L2Y0P3_PARTP
MPHERKKEHKGSQQATADDSVTWWQKFHFSGKVIMCSVFFGLGLVLVGGLLLAIGDHHDDENGNLNEVQNKAPMSIVGPIIMGIGSFTVFVGIIMCLFETNICRKRQPDSTPLIDEQNPQATSRNSDASSIPSTSQKREKHRHHKKSSSPRKHKGLKKSEQNSPSSMPIDMHRSLSRDLTSSDKFLTPPSSLANEHQMLQPTCSDAENQTSASLLKSFTSSGKSWNTSTEFQTPASSLQDSSGSFMDQNSALGISPEHKVLNNDRLKTLKHEFLTPKNSSAEIIDKESSPPKGAILKNTHQAHSDDNVKSKELDNDISDRLDVLNHDFVTPMNSYVDQPNVSAPKWDVSKEDATQIVANIEENADVEKSFTEKTTENKEGKPVDMNDETRTLHPNAISKDVISDDLKASDTTSDSTLTTENISNISNDVVS